MAEINSQQVAKLLAGTKLLPNERGGRVRLLYAKAPVTYSAPAINDTLFLGRVPVNSRFLATMGGVSCAAGTASGTVSIGLRSTKTGSVIAAGALAVGVDIAAAGQKALIGGTLLANGADGYVTTEEVDVYATFTGAVGTANQAIKFEIPYVTD